MYFRVQFLIWKSNDKYETMVQNVNDDFKTNIRI